MNPRSSGVEIDASSDALPRATFRRCVSSTSPVVAVLVTLVLHGCATYTSSIAPGAPTEARVALAGATLDCAARAQKSAFFLFLGSSLSAGVANVVVVAAANSPSATLEVRGLAALVALGLSGVSIGTGIGTLGQLWTSADYTQRAGEVAAGVATDGACREAPVVMWREMKPRVRSRAEVTDRGSRGTRCYPNGTCNQGLSCVDSFCTSKKSPEQPRERQRQPDAGDDDEDEDD
jgi:hypothetical protein